jgi:hypothetical protein
MDEASRTCIECQGVMSPIVVMDKIYRNTSQGLEYRRPDDSRSFWTGKYPSAGPVQAFLCGDCGRIDLYGEAPVA